ncbi:organomercurial lyase [Sedimentitalea sp. XS_ASV28]|uniref:organomercurial lyase n=1 Tax=Sedimentitalea sp. XS_ASV28 TaxID=3241296 RepID=UPI003519B744
MTTTQTAGVPDPSLVTSARVNEALSALLTEARLASRWNGLLRASQSAHHQILSAFLSHGRPPDIAAFSDDVLEDLGKRDLVHVRDGGIALAYPFSTVATDFGVSVEGVGMHAVCAIDALGVAAMTSRRTEVSCRCPVCQVSTSVTVAADGLTIEAASSRAARVWAGVTEVGTCAADSQCKTMRLFCSPAHLATWLQNHAPTRGFDLTLEEGVQLGAAIFRPFLNDDVREDQY